MVDKITKSGLSIARYESRKARDTNETPFCRYRLDLVVTDVSTVVAKCQRVGVRENGWPVRGLDGFHCRSISRVRAINDNAHPIQFADDRDAKIRQAAVSPLRAAVSDEVLLV